MILTDENNSTVSNSDLQNLGCELTYVFDPEGLPFCEVFHCSRQQGRRQVKLQSIAIWAMKRLSSHAKLVNVASAV